MKVLSHLLVALILLVLAAPAMAAVEVEGAVYLNTSSMYLWRGFDLSDGDPVLQGGMDVGFKGLTFSYWSNLDLDSGELNETDFTIDYGFALSDLVAIGVGNVFYSLEGLADTNELYLGVSLNTVLAPTLTLYYDYDEAEETGLFYTFSVAQSFELTKGLTLNLGGLVSYNQESDYAVGDYNDWHNAELSAGIDYALTEQLSLSPSLIFSTPISDDAEDLAGLEDEFLAGVTLTLSF